MFWKIEKKKYKKIPRGTPARRETLYFREVRGICLPASPPPPLRTPPPPDEQWFHTRHLNVGGQGHA